MSTIAAIVTASGVGGIAVIRVSGENAIEICNKIFKAKSGISILNAAPYTVHFGLVSDLEGNLIDEALCTIFKAPNSFTGEDTIELSCHGGIQVSNNVLLAVLSAGATPALAGEFTKRAFLNGKMDLTRAEAVIDLINADSKTSAKAAFWQLEGVLGKKIEGLSNALTDINAEILAFVDYPDEDIADVSKESLLLSLQNVQATFQKLITSFDSGSAIKNGIHTAIIGKPNSGKSSLMNLLSGQDKSIVTHIAGTTRDIIEETVILGGIKLILSDTAGIREAEELVEKIGVEKTLKAIEKSELVLCVFNGNEELDEEDKKIISFAQDKKSIAVINKTDLPVLINKEYIKNNFKHIVYISALTGEGQSELEKEIEGIFLDQSISIENGELITNIRHKNCLLKAKTHIDNAINEVEKGITADAISIDIMEALSALGEICGQAVNEKVIHNIFSRFCVGK